MKTTLLKLNFWFTFFISFLLTCSFAYYQSDDNLAHFIVKVNSAWGSKCEKCVEYEGYNRKYDDTYKVWMVNTSEQTLDVKCCVQEESKNQTEKR